MEKKEEIHKYEIEEPQIEYEDKATIMDEPFDPTLIKIETKTPSLDTLIKRLRRNHIQMNVETYFQRGVDLWSKTDQSRLIESILIRFPLPAFFFDASDDDNWLVVDGLQRLSSIRNFVVDKTLKLQNLEFLTQLNGKSWDDLPVNLQRLIEETQVVIYKIMPGTPDDVKFNIFKRINTGGLVLSSQEIRHALFQGIPADFVYELANSEAFLKATNGKINPKRMQDRDFVNRFLAFYINGVENYGTKEWGQDLDTYMSNVLTTLRKMSANELEEVRQKFAQAMNLSYEIFHDKAFRKISGEYDRTPPINKALFDALSTQLALLNEEETHVLLEYKEEFREALKNELAENEDFMSSVSSATGGKRHTLYRHKTIEKLIQSMISHEE